MSTPKTKTTTNSKRGWRSLFYSKKRRLIALTVLLVLIIIAALLFYWFSTIRQTPQGQQQNKANNTTQSSGASQTPASSGGSSTPGSSPEASASSGATTNKGKAPSATSPTQPSSAPAAPSAPATPAAPPNVTAVTLGVNSTTGSATCGATYDFVFTGTITADGPGTITYHWFQTDIGDSGAISLNFASAGTKTVSKTWSLSGTYDVSGPRTMRLETLTPNSISKLQNITFTSTCI